MSYTICYISKSVKDLEIVEIESIFESTVRKNTEWGITGILLYNSGHFFQVLEGEKDMVKTLFYDLIYPDDRHSDLFVVMEQQTPEPFFSSYKTQFSVVKTQKEYIDLQAYIVANITKKDSDKFQRLLAPFVPLLED